jgi:hypothetical protein
LIVTAAFGRTDPFGSVTVPSIALVNCANATAHVKVSANKRPADLESALTRILFIKFSFLLIGISAFKTDIARFGWK